MSTERQNLTNTSTEPQLLTLLPNSEDKGVLLDPSIPSDEEREFDQFINERLVGQPEAKACARRIFRRSRNKLRHPRRPIYMYIAAGPSTTGKSMLPRLMAQFDHGDPEAVLVINGAEFTQKEHLASLIGAHSELVGYAKPNEMGAKSDLEKDPYCEFAPHNLYVYSRRGSKKKITYIVVEEWDQACPEFNDVLMSIGREGFVTLGNGVRVYFHECVIVLTTNLGMKEVEADKRRPGFNRPDPKVSTEDIKTAVDRVLKQNTTKAFRNRINEIICYSPLTYEQMFEVVTREIGRLNKRTLNDPETMCTIAVDDPAKKFILDSGLEGDGDLARVLQIIETDVQDAIGGEMGKGTINSGDIIAVTKEEGKSGLSIYRKRVAGMLLNFPGVNNQSDDQAAAQPAATDGAIQPAPTTDAAGQADAALSQRTIQVAAQTGLIVDGNKSVQVPILAVVQDSAGQGLTTGVLLDLSYLMFLQRASDLKQVAARDERLTSGYVLTLTDPDNLDRLTMSCSDVVRELINVMGLKVLCSQSTYHAPYTVKMKVKAMPEQVALIAMRYPKVKVEPDGETDRSEKKAS